MISWMSSLWINWFKLKFGASFFLSFEINSIGSHLPSSGVCKKKKQTRIFFSLFFSFSRYVFGCCWSNWRNVISYLSSTSNKCNSKRYNRRNSFVYFVLKSSERKVFIFFVRYRTESMKSWTIQWLWRYEWTKISSRLNFVKRWKLFDVLSTFHFPLPSGHIKG